MTPYIQAMNDSIYIHSFFLFLSTRKQIWAWGVHVYSPPGREVWFVLLEDCQADCAPALFVDLKVLITVNYSFRFRFKEAFLSLCISDEIETSPSWVKSHSCKRCQNPVVNSLGTSSECIWVSLSKQEEGKSTLKLKQGSSFKTQVWWPTFLFKPLIRKIPIKGWERNIEYWLMLFVATFD